MQPPYTEHQRKYVANAIIDALARKPLTDTRPENPENRLVIYGATPTGKFPEVIDGTQRLIGIITAHPGLDVPITGVLLRVAQVRAWRAAQGIHARRELDEAIEHCQAVGKPRPRLWDPVDHPVNGWFVRPNLTPEFSNHVRRAALELLQIAIESDNVKALGSDMPPVKFD